MSDEPIISTKDQVGTYDAIETLKPGEPVFPIQGGDPLGPKVVQFWADEQRQLARSQTDEKLRVDMLKKAVGAEQVSWAMQAYQLGEEISALEISRSAQANVVIDDGQKWKLGLVAGTRHLREAAAHLTDALSHLPPEMAQALQRRIEAINRIATNYEPRRASYGNEPELPIS